MTSSIRRLWFRPRWKREARVEHWHVFVTPPDERNNEKAACGKAWPKSSTFEILRTPDLPADACTACTTVVVTSPA